MPRVSKKAKPQAASEELDAPPPVEVLPSEETVEAANPAEEEAVETDAPDDTPCGCPAKKKARYRSTTNDPSKPKRPPNAFMLYSKEQRTQFDKTMKVTEVAKEIGARWQQLGEEEKNRYKQMALELKEAR